MPIYNGSVELFINDRRMNEILMEYVLLKEGSNLRWMIKREQLHRPNY